MVKIKYLFVCFLLLLLSCNTKSKKNDSIKKDTSKVITNKKKDSLIITTDSLNKVHVENTVEIIDNWLKLFMSQDEILSKLGEPRRGKEEYWDAIGAYIQKWEYDKLGISLEMSSEKIGVSKKVWSINITSPCKFKTTQGVGIGSKQKNVKDKYLNIIDFENSDSSQIVVGTIYEGTIFTIKDEKVINIFIGAAAE